jgi:F-type H+-transporting ATPase subunit b
MSRRLILMAAFAVTLAVTPLAAQEEAAAEAGHEEQAEPSLLLKVVNFGILAAGLYLIGRKVVPPLLRSRTEEIQKDIAAARKTKQEADQRAAAMDARLRSLAADIETFRTQAAAEMQKEGERIRKETATQIKRLEEQAALEIESAGKSAQRELRQFASDLALKLAEERVRSRLDNATEAALVDGFVAELGRQGSNN